MYESMFKMEPRKFISRPKFLTTMRLVYGFELANLDAVSNTEMLDRLNILYSSFDVQRNDQMDWRCFVLMLEMCHAKTNTVLQHVKWGYSLYSSQGSFDTSFEEPMRLGDVKDLLATMCKVSPHTQAPRFVSYREAHCFLSFFPAPRSSTRLTLSSLRTRRGRPSPPATPRPRAW